MIQIIAVAILLVFYGCYFGKMFFQRQKGIQTDQMGKGKVGIVKVIELTMKVATIAVLVVELGSIYKNTSGLPVGFRVTGMVFGVLGDVVFILAVITMRDSWRAGVSERDRTELVTNGIYQISRNPAFLGFDLVYIGIMMLFFNWVLFWASVFAMLMLHLQIVNVEEPFLITTFGEQYIEYRKKVNRYFGRTILHK